MLYWVLGNDFFQHGTMKFGWKILNIMSNWSNQMALGQHLCKVRIEKNVVLGMIV